MKFHHCCCRRFLIALALQAGASAQSLADVAKAEEARRKTIKPGAKVYTNEDLGGTPPTSAAPAHAASAVEHAAKPGDPAKPEEQKAVDPDQDAEVLEGSCDGDSTVALAQQAAAGRAAKPGERPERRVSQHGRSRPARPTGGAPAASHAASCSACNRTSKSRPRRRPISRKKRASLVSRPAGFDSQFEICSLPSPSRCSFCDQDFDTFDFRPRNRSIDAWTCCCTRFMHACRSRVLAR